MEPIIAGIQSTSNAPKHPRFVRWALMLGIVIILNIFFVELVQLVMPLPQYNTYCPQTQVVDTYTTQASCIAAGGQWNPTTPVPQAVGRAPVQPSGYCDAQYTCNNNFQAATDLHARNAFIAFVVLGVLALIAGVIPLGSSIVSSGLSYGGVVTLIIGSIEYWGNAAIWIRLLIALVGLIALLYVGWRQFRD